MTIKLQNRDERHVRIYFDRTRDEEISAMIPQSANTIEQAIENFHKTTLPGASSYGRTIYADGIYVGDVWCYCINTAAIPNAMLSYCIFEKELWGRGIATEAVRLFLDEIAAKFHMTSIGAFAFYENAASIRVFEKQGFKQIERFAKNGVESVYCRKDL